MNLLLGFLTLMVMAGVAYASLREDILTAGAMCFNVILSGLVAFNYWELMAIPLDMLVTGTFLTAYVDAFCLFVFFSLTLGMLRVLTNNLARTELFLPPQVSRAGAIAFGLISGYIVSGILVCVAQTLPWDENFLYFESHYPTDPPAVQRVFPPDQVWLAYLSYQSGPTALSGSGDEQRRTLENFETFELRYAYYRRYTKEVDAQPYRNEKTPEDVRKKLDERRNKPQEFLKRTKGGKS